jgi:hypothetical protein
MPEMNFPRPSRNTTYLALVTVVVSCITAIFRKVGGDNPLVLGLGLIAVILLIVTLLRVSYERREHHKKIVAQTPLYVTSTQRFWRAAYVGAALVLMSFVGLALGMAVSTNAIERSRIFDGWLAVFLLGTVCMCVPIIVRWAIFLGLFKSNK